MKVLVNIGHPAHVHLFKNPIKNWLKKGNDVVVTVKRKDVNINLLEDYGLNYIPVSISKNNIVLKGIGLLEINKKILNIVKKAKPDILIGVFDPYIAQIGKITNRRTVIFTDTELVNFEWLVYPFADYICTPKSFLKNFGKKHVRYNGFHELAYLHPKYFKPDRNVLKELDIYREKFIVLRLISWSAHHDSSLRGINYRKLVDFIKILDGYGRVLISIEKSNNNYYKKLIEYLKRGGFEDRILKIQPSKFHSLLYYSELYIGEGGTTAVESSLLGTPSIHIETFKNGEATGNMTGTFLELKNKYKMLYYFPNITQALKKSIEILENADSKKEWKKKRNKLLSEKIDVTEWITNFIIKIYEKRAVKGR